MDKLAEMFAKPMQLDEVSVQIKPTGFDLVATSCGQCKEQYNNIEFDATVTCADKVYTPEYCVMKGRDSSCVCDEGALRQVLCTIDLGNDGPVTKEGSIMFVNFYVEEVVDEAATSHVIKLLKGL
jgi:hypothetical protein